MAKNTQIVALISLGLIIGALLAAAYYIPHYDDMQSQRNTLRADLRIAISEQDKLQQDVTAQKNLVYNAEVERDNLRSRLSTSQNELSSVNRQLSTTKTELSGLESTHKNLERTHVQLEQQHTSLTSAYSNQTVKLNVATVTTYEQQQQLSQVEGLLHDSYNLGYNDAQSSSSSTEEFSSLLDLLFLFL